MKSIFRLILGSFDHEPKIIQTSLMNTVFQFETFKYNKNRGKIHFIYSRICINTSILDSGFLEAKGTML